MRFHQKKTGEGTYQGFIKDQYGNIVYINDTQNTLPSLFEWDGTNINQEVSPGLYTYTLVAQDEAGNSMEVTPPPFELITEKAAIKVAGESSCLLAERGRAR